MAFSYPRYSKKQVDKSSAFLFGIRDWTQLDLFTDIDGALNIVNNWRAAHAYPLQMMRVTLETRAERVDPAAIVYQRQKRLEAIRKKYYRMKARHGRDFGVANMQDLGGCRAIMRDVSAVFRLDQLYAEGDAKNTGRGSVLEHRTDYIAKPKADGYRCLHRIYRYNPRLHREGAPSNRKKSLENFKGLRIEIQIRSRLQHQWASAVETAGRHINKDIKGLGGGKAWDRFFLLSSGAIALLEGCPLPQGVPTTPKQLAKEIARYTAQLLILKRTAAPLENIEGIRDANSSLFVVELNPESGNLRAVPYTKGSLSEAEMAIFSVERDILIEGKTLRDAVLVGVRPMDLRIAYPSYFLDASDFVRTIGDFIRTHSR